MAFQSEWTTDVLVPKWFMSITPNTGLLLQFLANAILNRINWRTDNEIDVHGNRFARYTKKRARNPDGTFARTPDGRFIQEDDRPVTLRSKKKVPNALRMRASLIATPSVMRPDTVRCTIKPVGGRDGVGHILRAASAQRPYLGGPRRQFIGISHVEMYDLLKDIRQAGSVAFLNALDDFSSSEKNKANVRRAIRAQQLVRAKRERMAKKAASDAESANDAAINRTPSRQVTGKKAGETAAEAYKRKQSTRRLRRRERAARKG